MKNETSSQTNDKKNKNIREDFSSIPSNVKPPEKRKMVKGIFKNLESPGVGVSFSFRVYKEAIKTYNLIHGGEYELPIEVVEHLNKNCGHKKYRWVSKDGQISTGKPVDTQAGWTKKVESVVSRFAFQPLEYVDAAM